MRPQSETRERFMKAIAERVTRDAIEAAHFFQPIKQGGIESGVAVVAVAMSSAAADANAPSALAENRLTVYTAQYRLTLKGPERGKWEFTMTADADAPLTTVEKVVSGVQRRSGDAEEPSRVTGDEFREMLPPPPPAPDAALPPAAVAGTMG